MSSLNDFGVRLSDWIILMLIEMPLLIACFYSDVVVTPYSHIIDDIHTSDQSFILPSILVLQYTHQRVEDRCQYVSTGGNLASWTDK